MQKPNTCLFRTQKIVPKTVLFRQVSLQLVITKNHVCRNTEIYNICTLSENIKWICTSSDKLFQPVLQWVQINYNFYQWCMHCVQTDPGKNVWTSAYLIPERNQTVRRQEEGKNSVYLFVLLHKLGGNKCFINHFLLSDETFWLCHRILIEK